MRTLEEVQRALSELGLYTGRVDGIRGNMTVAAIQSFQRLNNLPANGLYSEALDQLLFAAPIAARMIDSPIVSIKGLPADNTASLLDYYGEPGSNQVMLEFPYKMRLAWDTNQIVTRTSVHKKVQEGMAAIFEQTLKHYGYDAIHSLRLDLFGGCLNVRKIRGGTRWSTHSWGIAMDIDPASNQLKTPRPLATLSRAEYEPFWKIVESVGAKSLGRTSNYDWMHFQFTA